MLGAALQGIVVHGQELLVVVLARDGIGDLRDVHQLVNHDHEAGIARLAEEGGEDLQVIVPVIVGDDDGDAQVLPGLALRGVFATEPLHDLRFRQVVARKVGVIVGREQPGEFEAVDQFRHRRGDGGDAAIHLCGELRVSGSKPGVRHRRCLHAGNPAIQHQRQCTTLGFGLRGEVADELPIGGKALALGTVQAPLGRQVRVRYHEPAVHAVVANGLQKEALAGAVASHDETAGGAAFGNDVHVMQQRLDLALATHGDIGQAHPGHHAALEGIDDRACDAPRYLASFRTHASPSTRQATSSR